MNDDQRRELIQQVADGEVSPEEAAARLNASTTPSPASRAQTTSTAPERDDLERLIIRANGSKVTVIGDPSVATVQVTGDHSMGSEDRGLVIRVDESTLAGRPGGRPSRHRRGGHPGRRSPKAVIRMNPDLELDIVAQAGAVHVESMRAHIDATVNAGTLRLRNVTAPFDAVVRAGSLRVGGTLTHGESSIRCTMGKIVLALDPSSDVTVTTALEMGKTQIRAPQRPEGDSFTLGSGAASLDIFGTMCAADIYADRPYAVRSR